MDVSDLFQLDGKRLFITGGSRGLGREMALAIATAGADVALVARPSDSLENTAEDIRKLGRTAWTIEADVNTRTPARMPAKRRARPPACAAIWTSGA